MTKETESPSAGAKPSNLCEHEQDPYLCSKCQTGMTDQERIAWLENKVVLYADALNEIKRVPLHTHSTIQQREREMQRLAILALERGQKLREA